MITHIIIVTGMVYFILLTAMKHQFPLTYENWYDELKNGSFVKNVLPKDFCLLCFVTQCSLIVAIIIALLLAYPLWHIIIVIPCSAAFVIYLDDIRNGV